jgi:hypothetical protein
VRGAGAVGGRAGREKGRASEGVGASGGVQKDSGMAQLMLSSVPVVSFLEVLPRHSLFLRLPPPSLDILPPELPSSALSAPLLPFTNAPDLKPFPRNRLRRPLSLVCLLPFPQLLPSLRCLFSFARGRRSATSDSRVEPISQGAEGVGEGKEDTGRRGRWFSCDDETPFRHHLLRRAYCAKRVARYPSSASRAACFAPYSHRTGRVLELLLVPLALSHSPFRQLLP